MYYGGSAFVIAIGLILALAVNIDIQGIDIQMIGWILTIVGFAGLIVTIIRDVSTSSRRRQVKTTTVE